MIAQRQASSKPLPPDAESGRREHVDYQAFQDKMDTFKQTFIYDQIYKTEEETAEFAKWLNYLDVFVGPDFEFLNPSGTIPTSAILKVGEQRRAPGGQPKAPSTDTNEAQGEALHSDEEGETQGADDDA